MWILETGCVGAVLRCITVEYEVTEGPGVNCKRANVLDYVQSSLLLSVRHHAVIVVGRRWVLSLDSNQP